MFAQTAEARIIPACEAIQSSPKMSIRRAAKLFDVPRTTLQDRIHGRASIADTKPKAQLLDDLAEKAIVKRILDIDDRGFPPRLEGVEDMSNFSSRRVGNEASASSGRIAS